MSVSTFIDSAAGLHRARSPLRFSINTCPRNNSSRLIHTSTNAAESRVLESLHFLTGIGSAGVLRWWAAVPPAEKRGLSRVRLWLDDPKRQHWI